MASNSDFSLQSHEDFSLTGMLFKETSKWHKKGNVHSLGARTINFLCAPFTTLIDAISHLSIGLLSIACLAEIGWAYNLGAHLFSSQRTFPITFTGGIVNLYHGLRHTIGILSAPILGFSNPLLAKKLFMHNASQRFAKKKRKMEKFKDQILYQKRAKEHLVRNLKEINLTQKRKITSLQGKYQALVKSSKMGIEGNIKLVEKLSSKIKELESEKIQLDGGENESSC